MRETVRVSSRAAARLGAAWARMHGVTATRSQGLRLRPARVVIHPVMYGMLKRAGVDLDLYAWEWLTNDLFSGALWPHPAGLPIFAIEMRCGHLATMVKIGDGVTLDARHPGCDVITMRGVELPDSVVMLLPGRPLDDLIDTPYTRGLGLVVGSVERSDCNGIAALIVHLRTTPWVRVGSLRGAKVDAGRSRRRRMVCDTVLGTNQRRVRNL